jgi:hypothetical protein
MKMGRYAAIAVRFTQNKKASAIPDALKISARQFGAPVPRRRQNQEDEAIKNPDLSNQKNQ